MVKQVNVAFSYNSNLQEVKKIEDANGVASIQLNLIDEDSVKIV